MKKIISALLLTSSLTAFACTDSTRITPQWSVGIIGYGRLHMPYSGMQNYFVTGMQVGHNNANGKWSQRIAYEHTQQSITTPEFPPGSADIPYIEGYEKQTVLRAGVERRWSLHKLFHPYVALDVAGRFNKSDVRITGGFGGFQQRKETWIKSIGLMPAVGFKTFFGKHIALYAEYRVESYMNNNDYRTTNYNGNVDYRPYADVTFDFNAGSAVAGIQVAF